MLRENKLTELYKFAVKYARSFRSAYVEADDLAQEMMLAVMKVKWKSDAYATTVMRNRFYDLMKRAKVEREHHVPFDAPEVQSKYVCEDARWDARINVDRVFNSLPPAHAKVLIRMLRGEALGVSQRTAYRYQREARSRVGV